MILSLLLALLFTFHVIDGDTIELSSEERVRYIGVDTAEATDELGKAIAEYNHRLVEGQIVRLEFDKELLDLSSHVAP